MSGDPKQEYFSDGKKYNSLARVNDLQVAGRTSSFYFKGKDVDLDTIEDDLGTDKGNGYHFLCASAR